MAEIPFYDKLILLGETPEIQIKNLTIILNYLQAKIKMEHEDKNRKDISKDSKNETKTTPPTTDAEFVPFPSLFVHPVSTAQWTTSTSDNEENDDATTSTFVPIKNTFTADDFSSPVSKGKLIRNNKNHRTPPKNIKKSRQTSKLQRRNIFNTDGSRSRTRSNTMFLRRQNLANRNTLTWSVQQSVYFSVPSLHSLDVLSQSLLQSSFSPSPFSSPLPSMPSTSTVQIEEID